MARQQGEAVKLETTRIASVAFLITASLLWVGATQGATASAPGLSATLTSTVLPTRLPQTGSAPVTFAATGTLTATDGSLHPVRAIELRLDRQLGVTATGLPTCTPGALSGLAVQQARQRCRKALVGSGTATQEFLFALEPGEAPLYSHPTVLFFNATAKGATPQLLTYFYFPPGPPGAGFSPGPSTVVSRAAITKTSGSYDIQIPDARIGGAGALVAFRFRFGKTWQYKGQEQGYLSGRCATGTLRNRVTVGLLDGTDLAGASSEPCTSGASR